MAYLRIILRVVSCSIIALITFELCARLDDYFAYEAPILSSYDIDQIYEFDSIGRKGKPNTQFRKWKLNSLGYRGPELRVDSVKIAVFGASETFGLYESQDHEFPRLLEKHLNEKAGRRQFDVVNVAYAGMPTSAMVRRVPEIAQRVQPRLAIIYPTPANYIWLPWLKGAEKASPVPKFDFRLKDQLRTAAKSVLPDHLENWLRAREIERSVSAYGKVMERLPQENVDRYIEDLRALARRLRDHGIEPVILTHAHRFHNPPTPEDEQMLIAWRKFYPMLSERGFLDMERRMNEASRALGEAERYTVIDIAGKIPPGSRYFADFTHFTDEGSNLFGETLANAVYPLVQRCCVADRQVARNPTP
jgi:lysophospholipase L1-like esterase